MRCKIATTDFEKTEWLVYDCGFATTPVVCFVLFVSLRVSRQSLLVLNKAVTRRKCLGGSVWDVCYFARVL